MIEVRNVSPRVLRVGCAASESSICCAGGNHFKVSTPSSLEFTVKDEHVCGGHHLSGQFLLEDSFGAPPHPTAEFFFHIVELDDLSSDFFLHF